MGGSHAGVSPLDGLGALQPVNNAKKKLGLPCGRCGKRIWNNHFCFNYDIQKFIANTKLAALMATIPTKRCIQCRKDMKVTFKKDTNEVERYGHVNGRNLFCSIRCGMSYAVDAVNRNEPFVKSLKQ